MRYEDVVGQLQESYDGAADRRDGMVKEPFKLAERDGFLRRLRTAGAGTLLEVGAGTGQDSAFFAGAGLDVTAVDLSPEMVARCRAKGLTAHVRQVLDLRLPVGSYDAVWSMNCLLHVPPRFFAWRTDDELRGYLTRSFEIVDFHRVETGGHPFQAVTLRRP